MNFIFILIIYDICKCENIIYNHTNKDNNLYFVFTTFRHGARNAFTKIDIFGNYINSPGNLSKYGCIQHLEIGKIYRKRYSNFLNMSFDYKQIYIRTSDIERTIISTQKQLEGFFNKKIDRKYFDIIKDGLNYSNLYHLNNKEQKIMDIYVKYCNKRILEEDYLTIFKTDIFPILQKYYGIFDSPNLYEFCDSVYTSYLEYIYDNDTNNKIIKCGIKNAKKMNDFCYNWYNSFKGWNEYGAYMFYMLFQHIFEYMNMSINGTSSIKMIMIGGHDVTIDKFMDFLDGIKVIPRIEYPHFAFNIVIELRKYNNNFYLEFYYNDILKYNNTYQNFINTLNNSTYSNLYNYCGIPLKYKIKLFYEQKNYLFYFIIIFFIFIFILLIFLIYKIYFYYLRKKEFIKLIKIDKIKNDNSIILFNKYNINDNKIEFYKNINNF